MITNFEDFTGELSDDELNILPAVIHSFRRYKKDNPIKAPEIIEGINIYLKKRGYKFKMSGPRLRKMVNFIRSNSLLPLIATSKGYFTDSCKLTIQEQIKSLEERSRSIQKCADGLKSFL
jgi:hypothetical protein